MNEIVLHVFLSVFELYQDDKKNDKNAFEQHSALKS